MSEAEAKAPTPIEESALYRVRRWTLLPTLRALREPLLHGLSVEELDRMIALGGLDLAAAEIIAAYATDRERRREAAEALCGGAIRALLSPHGAAEPAALRHLEHVRRGLSAQGLTWGSLTDLAEAACNTTRSRAERAAAATALSASHLALGDPPLEEGRAAMIALSMAFDLERAPAALCITVAHLERKLAERELRAPDLAALFKK